MRQATPEIDRMSRLCWATDHRMPTTTPGLSDDKNSSLRASQLPVTYDENILHGWDFHYQDFNVKLNRNHERITYIHTKLVRDVRTILFSRYDSSIPISQVSNRRNFAVSIETAVDMDSTLCSSSENAVAMKFKVAIRWSESEIGGRSTWRKCGFQVRRKYLQVFGSPSTAFKLLIDKFYILSYLYLGNMSKYNSFLSICAPLWKDSSCSDAGRKLLT